MYWWEQYMNKYYIWNGPGSDILLVSMEHTTEIHYEKDLHGMKKYIREYYTKFLEWVSEGSPASALDTRRIYKDRQGPFLCDSLFSGNFYRGNPDGGPWMSVGVGTEEYYQAALRIYSEAKKKYEL